MGLGIGIRDCGLGLGIGIGNRGLRLGIGRMTNDNDYTLHFVFMRMNFILFLHIVLELLLCFFKGCVVAGLMKNKYQLSLTSFLDYSSLDKQLLF